MNEGWKSYKKDLREMGLFKNWKFWVMGTSVSVVVSYLRTGTEDFYQNVYDLITSVGSLIGPLLVICFVVFSYYTVIYPKHWTKIGWFLLILLTLTAVPDFLLYVGVVTPTPAYPF